MADETERDGTTDVEDQQAGGPEGQTEETPKVVPFEDFEAVKRAQAGSDRAYQQAQAQIEKLQQEFDALQKRSMSDKERTEFESAERQKQLEAKEREVADASLRLTRMSLIAENNLPKEFERFAVGETEEQIRESMNSLKTLINQAAEGMVTERLKSPGSPRSGSTDQKVTINEAIRGQYASRKGL